MTYQIEQPDTENFYQHCSIEVHVFFVTEMQAIYNAQNIDHANAYTPFVSGWYFQYPEDVPEGPYVSKEIAAEEAGLTFDSTEQDEFEGEELEAAF